MLNTKLLGAVSKPPAGEYIDDLFSTYLYTGNGSTQTINNGINLGDQVSNVTLLLNGNSITDSSTLALSLTNIGSVAVSTSIYKYGTGSLSFSGSQKLLTSSNASIPIAAGQDFTVEAWVYPDSASLSGLVCIATPRVGSNNWYFGLYLGGVFLYDESVGVFSAGTLTANTWQHVAYSRQGTTHRLFLNGILVGSMTAPSQVHPSSIISIGSDNSGSTSISGGFVGYIDDLRLTKNAALYTGNFTPPTSQLVNTSTVLSVGKGGMVWIKKRTGSSVMSNYLTDTARGISDGYLSSNTTNASNPTQICNAFNSNGFGYNPVVSDTGDAVCSWTFRKAPKFFDVVTYTGDGASERQVSHSLGSAPGMVIVKSTSNSANWAVWHRSLGATSNNMYLNLTSANGANADFSVTGAGTMSSTSFCVSSTLGLTNASGQTYVAYLFAHDAGGFGAAGTDNVISCGSFTTDSSGNATVNLGYEPQYILCKYTSTSPWYVFDTMRGFSLTAQTALFPNTSSAENTYTGTGLFPTATGFSTLGTALFDPNATLIYMAIRRPMKPPTSGTQVFSPIAYTGSGTNSRAFTTNFATDATFWTNRDKTIYTQNFLTNKLVGLDKNLDTSTTGAEANTGAGRFGSFTNTQVVLGTTASGGFDYAGMPSIIHAFRRATGFFDVVCYTGDGSSTQIPHNLGAIPELCISKRRAATSSWFIDRPLNTSAYNQGAFDSAAFYDNWLPSGMPATATTIRPPNSSSGQTMVMYLFATLAGVSKVGEYTGDGTDGRVINCGFTGGARFVLIKRIDGTGNWRIWDTARGIVSGNDPFLTLNTTTAESTNSDDIDPTSSGFIVNYNGLSAINEPGWSYIFLAIA